MSGEAVALAGGRVPPPSPISAAAMDSTSAVGAAGGWGLNPGVMILPGLPWLPGTAPQEPWLGRMCPLGGELSTCLWSRHWPRKGGLLYCGRQGTPRALPL